MILRRITEHVREQNWLAVFLDFAIVVVGVFIGIQVANWNEARHEDARQARVIEFLIADLAEIERAGEASWEGYDRRVQAAIRVSDFLRSDAALPADAEQFEADLDLVLTARVALLRSPTIVELLASGDTGLIDDEGLRFEIIRFDQSMQSAAEVNTGIIDIWTRYTETISAHAYEVFEASGAPGEYQTLRFDYDIEALRGDPAVLPALSWIANINIIELGMRRNITEEAARLRSRLEAE